MIRDSKEPNSTFVDVILSGSHGPVMQWRSNTGGWSGAHGNYGHMDSVWLKLEKMGNFFTGSWSANGIDWTEINQLTVVMDNPVYIGLAVTSHNNDQLATAEFNDFSIFIPTQTPVTTSASPTIKHSTSPSKTPSKTPSPLTSETPSASPSKTTSALVLTSGDIGNPGMVGSTIQVGKSFTVKGGGRDIWGNSDQFHFASKQVT